MTFENPGPDALRALLLAVKTIAVVGYSTRASRPSHNISRQMQRMGYRIIPVRPGIAQGLGEKAYARLEDIPEPVDLVNLFRNGRHAPETVEACLRTGMRALWMQEGCSNEEAAERAREAGLTVVMNRCILRDYTRLCL
ncbi:MAG: CoA-binding protein [Burkholderiales bacterium]|nr:CoA-binding protein [Burkholderiales bacterium]